MIGLHDINNTLILPSLVYSLAKSDSVIEGRNEVKVIEARLIVNGILYIYERSSPQGGMYPDIKARDNDYKRLRDEMFRIEEYDERKRLSGR